MRKISISRKALILIGIICMLLTNYSIVNIKNTNTGAKDLFGLYVIADDNDDYPFSIEFKPQGLLNPNEEEEVSLESIRIFREIWYEIQITTTFDHDEDILAHLRILFEGIADPMPQLELNDIKTLIKGPGYTQFTTLTNWGSYSENTKAITGESLNWTFQAVFSPLKEKFNLKFKLTPSFPGVSLRIFFWMEGWDLPTDTSLTV
jgi:hypothetical protein